MSDVCETQKEGRELRRMRSIYQVHYGLRPQTDEMSAKPLTFPNDSDEVHAYALQVAGHQSTKDTKYTGLLQCNGRVLKPILKESQKREVEFYERLVTTSDPDLIQLRKFVPKYFGVKKFTFNGHEQDYIILEDLTERMLEPCIMDVKIGKRTWDSLATAEKRKKEDSKYKLCKQEFGFCIPGYQVYKLSTGKLQKYNKDYGKKLQGEMVIAAIRNYLNTCGASDAVCRTLLLQQLAALWALQRWAAAPRALRLAAASLLLVYDAARLRHAARNLNSSTKQPVMRRKSIHSTYNPTAGSNFSGQISSNGPVYKKVNPVPLSSMAEAQSYFAPPPPVNSPWSEALEKLNHSHSFEHNYEDKLSKIKMNYRAVLDQLSSESPHPNPWGTVKLIDFAHAFFNDDEEETVDYNFKEGIDSFVHIYESLLRETDDQVF